jgi:Ni/Co efflux regulator RcnB
MLYPRTLQSAAKRETLMKRVAGILAIISVLGGSAALADPHFDGAHERGEQSRHRDWQQDGRWSRHDDRAPPREFYRNDHRRFEQERDSDRYNRIYGYRYGRIDGDRYGPIYDRYARPNGRFDFRRGDRLPVAYYGRPYVIDDYRGCGLYAPPRGYRWVRVDENAVLAAIATGIVLDAVYHAF